MNASPDANLAEAQRWYRQAERQFGTAAWNAQGGCWDMACFLCQQAGELALKALLMRQGDRVRAHGMLHLVERLTAYYPDIQRMTDAARSLDRFYVPTRYPDALPVGISSDYFVEQDFESAKAAALEILRTAGQILTSG